MRERQGDREQSMTAKETARLIDWLAAHGHTAEDATACIKFIADAEAPAEMRD